MFKASLIPLVITGCISERQLGDAEWTTEVGPFNLAYAVPVGGGWMVKTISYDGSVGCSEAPGIGEANLSLVFSTAALAAPGEVPITLEPLNPVVAQAQVSDVGPYASGTVWIYRVDEVIAAEFEAHAAGKEDMTGRFTAPRCD